MSNIVDTKEVILTSDATGATFSAATWDPQTGRLISTYKSAAALGNKTLVTLNDSYILGADASKPRLHIWPLNSQCPVSNLRLTTPGKVTALTSTPNGAYIVAAIGEKLYVWQLCNGRLWATLTRHYQTVTCLKFSKDGAIFASGGEDGLVFVWSLYKVINEEESSPIHAFSHHSLPVKDLYFGHCGARARLCSVSLDRTANIYEASSGTLLLKLVFDDPLTAVCMNAKETDLFAGHANGIIRKFNLHNPPREIEHNIEDKESNIFRGRNESIIAMSVSTDCKILLTASGMEVNLWDIASKIILVTIEHKGPVTSASFVKRFENFNVADLRPSLQVRNLQRSYGDYPEGNVIDVIRRDQDPSTILDFDSFVEAGTGFGEPEERTSRKMEEMREEIEKLKKINAAMYKYSVNCILNK